MLFVLAGPQLGSVFLLEAPCVLIGRDAGVDVHMTEDTVSLRHALVTQGTHGMQIEDQGSRSGTFVNAQRIAGARPLLDGDRIRIGASNILKFSMMDELEQRALTTLSELTLLDPLTRLYNRRYFDRRLHSELAFAARHGMQMALLMIDVDRFKHINDTRGHRMGDLVLSLVARTLERLMRPEDVAARLGGDEFIVLARATSLRNLEILGQRICQRIASATVSGHEDPLHVTVSVGGALLETATTEASEEALISNADRAMYRAKQEGRNRVVVCQVAPDSSPPPFPAGLRPTRPPPSA